MNDLSDLIARDARLAVLQELARQVDSRLNEMSLVHVLDMMGVRRSREWLRTQLYALAELGAVRLETVGSVTVAELTRAGRDHVERRVLIDGVSRPGDV